MNEFLSNADIAFANKQYEEALKWYIKVLSDSPDDLYALSRCGAISVSLRKFEDALNFFEKAKSVDPKNGDNLFNCGNAWFFNNDYVKAFNEYVEAERLGCSAEVTPRLYYQMALICSINQDIKSALVYFQKCEDSDKDGLISLNPDLISEKLKLNMALQNFAEAEKCAAQLVAILPTSFNNYMVYFSILMAHKNFVTAEKVLMNAEKYSDMTEENKFSLSLQFSSLYVAIGENSLEKRREFFEKAISTLSKELDSKNITDEQKRQIILTLSDIYLKDEQYDKSIDCVLALLVEPSQESSEEEAKTESLGDLTKEEAEQSMRRDIEKIREKLASGEIDRNLGNYAAENKIQVKYDKNGHRVHIYDPSVFKSWDSDETESPDTETKNEYITQELTSEERDKVYFTLLSAYLGKDDFKLVAEYANILKNSSNKYYSYYGIYTLALAERKLCGSSAQVERQYAEAIAFFRNKSFEDPKDSLASIFRARLYTEQGSIEKAKEIANMLSEADKKSILQYIEEHN